MVAQEHRPLAGLADLGRLRQDLHHRVAVFLGDGHVHARHEREVVGHVALVTLAEVLAHVLGPHVGLGQQQLVGVLGVDPAAQFLDHLVRLAQVLVARAFALDEVGNGVEAEPVHALLQPELHHAEHRRAHLGVVEVQVGLVAEEPMPVVLPGDLVPGPVRFLGVAEDDARAGVGVRVVAPDIEVALGRAPGGLARRLEPRVLVGSVVEHQFGDHAQPARMGLAHQAADVGHRAVGRVHAHEVGHVVAVVAQRRRVEGEQPDRVDAEVAHVIELVDEPGKVAAAVTIGVVERLDVQLVDDRVLVPGGIVGEARGAARAMLKSRNFALWSHRTLPG